MPSNRGSFLRQLSGKKESWKSTSKKWVGDNINFNYNYNSDNINNYNNNSNYNYSHNHSYSYGSATEMGGGGGGYGGGHSYSNSYGGDGNWGQIEGYSNEMYGAGDGGYSCGGQTGYNNNGGACQGGGMVVRKRVMVVVDQSARSKHAMMWALTHVANEGDVLTLLQVSHPSDGGGGEGVSRTTTTTGGSSETLSTSSSSSSSGSGSAASSSYSYSSCSSGGGFGGGSLASSLGSLCKSCKPEVEVEALVIRGPKLATVLSQVKKLEVSVLVLGQKKPSPLINCLFGMSSSEALVEQCINKAECLTIGVRKQSKGMGGYLISTRFQKNFWLLA